MKKNIDIKIDDMVIGTFVADEGEDFNNAMIAARRMLKTFPEAYLYVTDKETTQAINDICNRVEEIRNNSETYEEDYYEDEYDDDDCDEYCECDDCCDNCCQGDEKDLGCENCFCHDHMLEDSYDENKLLDKLLKKAQYSNCVKGNDLVEKIF